jgi:pyroglutamyl-peptidase
MKPWLLATGFGAFPGVPDNPSASLVRQLDGAEIAGIRVRSHVLDVSYRRAAEQVRAVLVAASLPCAVVHFGVAAGSQQLHIEAQAVNCRAAPIPDIDGVLGLGDAVQPDLPQDAVLVSRVDVAALAAALVANGVATEVSHDAGRYVCNSTYFSSLAWLQAVGADELGGVVGPGSAGVASATVVPCVFVHLPAPGSPDPQGIAWTTERLLAAGLAVLSWFCRR